MTLDLLLKRCLPITLIRFFAVAILTLTTILVPAHAALLRGNPETYGSVLRLLQPGDDLILESGLYRQGMPLHGLQGTQPRPITIRGPADGPPAVFIGRSGHNTISLSNTAHVHISNLTLDGRNLEVDAVKAEGRKDCLHVHHIILQNLLIVGHGADQQVVAISSKCPAWNWVIRRNVIVGAGTGLYLGNSDGSAPFVGGLIEQNIVIDTLGYNLQIKHQNERPAGIGMPTGRARTVIRHNLFTKAQNAAPGLHARPNILLGHFPRQGSGSEDIHEVTNNLFFCNPVESLMQAEGNLTITGNILVNPAGDAVSIQPHHDIPKHVRLDQNFVAASGRGVSITAASPSYPQSITHNWLISPKPLNDEAYSGTPITPLLPFRSALLRWLEMENGSTTRVKAFDPLVLSANRLCSDQADGHLSNFPWMQNRLRNHPVCNIIELLKPSHRKSAPRLKHLESLDSVRHNDTINCTL